MYEEERLERWAIVPEFSDAYMVSDLGRVVNRKRNLVISQWRKDTGYAYVSLSGGKKRNNAVHDLVALTFIGPPEPGEFAIHLDGDKTNNVVSNLIWGTASARRSTAIASGYEPPDTTRRDYLSMYEEIESGCWIYTGSINNNGYGSILGRGAHRYFYTKLVGPIPDGLTIDHLCRNPPCVNPAHLEPVTQAENNRRKPCVDRDHCKNGHPMVGANVKTYRTRHGGIGRACRTCSNANNRRYRSRLTTD